MELSEIKRRIRNKEKDYVMPIYLPFLPAIISLLLAPIIIVSVVLEGEFFEFFIAGVVSSVVLGVIAVVMGIYVFYKWIDRRNKHFKRVRMFYEYLLDYFEEKGMEKESRRVRRSLREMESDRNSKSPVLWLVLSIIFNPVIFYVLHFLNKDFYEHEKQENFVMEDIEELAQEAGTDFEFDGYDTIEDRNSVLYLVLTIITAGLFGLYWIYVITKDPNKHFKRANAVENRLLDSLESLE